MILKKLFVTLLVLFSISISAQSRSFAFSEIQTRDDKQQWGNSQNIGMQTARFTPTQISLKADKDYRLNIISKTDLPDRGAIYLCKDDKSNEVTVTLIDNIKMFVYTKTKRFLINFDTFASHATMADND